MRILLAILGERGRVGLDSGYFSLYVFYYITSRRLSFLDDDRQLSKRLKIKSLQPLCTVSISLGPRPPHHIRFPTTCAF